MLRMNKREKVLPTPEVNSQNAETSNKPIRVAQVLNRMDSGGIEAVVLNYYRHIDRNKVQFDFFFAEGSNLPQREELKQLGAGLYSVPAYSHPIAYQKALYAAFKQHGYRIVHAHLSTMSLFPLFAAWRAGVPVRICHNHSTSHWGEGAKTLLKYILRPFNKLFATEWFACGEKTGRWMYGDQAFEAGKVIVMPNAIDTAKFAYDAEARIALRKEFGIPLDAFAVGHVGRFTYAKNHSFLLKVFAELLKEKSNACLLLVGEGELEHWVRQEVQKMHLQSHIIFAGTRADVNKLYSAMDVFCLPSLYEGMPLVAWEAQASGLPCVFSEGVTREAALTTNEPFLSLRTAEKDWTAAFCQSLARKKIEVPDISIYVEWLKEFYIGITDQLKGNIKNVRS